jgi:hypothetical protein
LNASATPTVIYQSDLKEGTYRIRTPGYYVLGENLTVNFNPATVRPDMLPTGAIAGISIECPNVRLNGRGFSITGGDNLYAFAAVGSKASALNKIYAHILLANAAFPAFIANLNPPTGILRFLGETQYVAATNVLVENIKIFDSPHMGIYGPGDHQTVHLHNVSVKGCEISGITINATDGICLHNVTVDGKLNPQRPFVDTLPLSQRVGTVGLLQQFKAVNDVTPIPLLGAFIDPLLGELVGEVAAEAKAVATGARSSPVVESTRYGIVLQHGATSILSALLNNTLVDIFNSSIVGGSRVNARLRNVTVKNVDAAPEEYPLIAYGAVPFAEPGKTWIGQQGLALQVARSNPFVQALQWSEMNVDQKSATFAPSALLRACSLGMLLVQNLPGQTTNLIDPTFALTVLSYSPSGPALPWNAAVRGFVQPALRTGATGDFLRGVSGLVVRGFQTYKERNVDVECVKNTADAALSYADVPGALDYSPALPPLVPSYGPAVWGKWIQAGAQPGSVFIRNGNVEKVTSTNGPAFGLHLTDVGSIAIKHHCFDDVAVLALVQSGTFANQYQFTQAQVQRNRDCLDMTRSSASGTIQASWR